MAQFSIILKTDCRAKTQIAESERSAADALHFQRDSWARNSRTVLFPKQHKIFLKDILSPFPNEMFFLSAEKLEQDYRLPAKQVISLEQEFLGLFEWF